MDYPTISVLDTRVHKISRLQLERDIVSALSAKSGRPLFIATINPSFIMKAQKDIAFRNILNTATTINVADGVGLKLADRGLEIITGVDLTLFILSQASKLDRSVLIVVKASSLTSRSTLIGYLRNKYPKLSFDVLISTSPMRKHDVLLCALGEGLQEKFIVDNIAEIEPLVAVGVGGAFDVITGTIKAPRTRYLNWVFRLLSNPKRFPKTIRSVLVFPVMVLLNLPCRYIGGWHFRTGGIPKSKIAP